MGVPSTGYAKLRYQLIDICPIKRRANLFLSVYCFQSEKHPDRHDYAKNNRVLFLHFFPIAHLRRHFSAEVSDWGSPGAMR